MAWLAGWDKRIKLDIGDYAGDIGGAVTWFPVTVFLTASQCEEVFVELTTDAEFPKVAFTKADGETELYGECELFDVSEELGIYHVSRDGWVVNANTSIYMYYDADHADNDTYIGAVGVRTEVWDGNSKGVWHFGDNADDSIATSDLTLANNPLYVAGKVGKAIDFELDTSQYAYCVDNANVSITGDITIEAWIKLEQLPSTVGSGFVIVGKWHQPNEESYMLYIHPTTDKLVFIYYSAAAVWTTFTCDTAFVGGDVGAWRHVTATIDVSAKSGAMYINGVSKAYTKTEGGGGAIAILDSPANFDIGVAGETGTFVYYFDGIIDDVKLEATERSAAWIKGTYNTTNDSLFTYGSEETLVPLTSTIAITTSITSSLSRGITVLLTATSAITTSITSALSRGITVALTATSAMTTSITSSLSRGITVALTATSAITSSLTASLSRGITQALTATMAITSSITSSISRGITASLTSTISITTSLLGRLLYDWWEEIKPTIDWTEETKSEMTWTEEDKGEIDWDEEEK